MGLLVAFLVVVAVIVLLTKLKPGSPDDEVDTRGGLPRIGTSKAPDTWVEVRASLGPPEAAVAQALLESHGVRAALEPTGPMAEIPYGYPVPALRYRLYVAPEDAEAAFALMDTAGSTSATPPLDPAPLRTAPDDWVQVGAYDAGEAQAARGLLDSCGIRAAWEASGPHVAGHFGSATNASLFRVYVSPDDAETARELLQS